MKEKIKEWVRSNFGDVRAAKESILEEMQSIDLKEELCLLLMEEVDRRSALKVQFATKVREEEIKWKQRSRVRWLKVGDKNSKFFHGMLSARQRINKIDFLLERENKIEDRESITTHVIDFFRSLYTKEDWDRPVLDYLQFETISEDNVSWLQREFDEQDIKEAVFSSSGEKSVGPDGFPMAFF